MPRRWRRLNSELVDLDPIGLFAVLFTRVSTSIFAELSRTRLQHPRRFGSPPGLPNSRSAGPTAQVELSGLLGVRRVST
jgi:hypothetical protein